MRLELDYGRVVAFEELPANSVALDGYVAGPAVDAERRRFSFDHHGAGWPRLVLPATCQQVAVALELGLALDEGTRVFLNDLDADTLLAAWLLARAGERPWLRPDVRAAVEAVGFVDAHGPVRPMHPLHAVLTLSRTQRSSDAALRESLAVIDEWVRGGALPAAPEAAPASRGFCWRPGEGWGEGEFRDFAEVYGAGFLAGVLWREERDGTRSYGAGKKSDVVALPLGPASLVRPPRDDSDYLPTLLGTLALAERRVNPGQAHATNWGGGTSIGGAPRNPDGSASRLSPDEVLAILRDSTRR